MRFFSSKSGRRGSNSRHSAWKADALPTELLPRFTIFKSSFDFPRAEDEGRTRDIQLGRLTLYQLSYFRILRFLNLCLIFPRAEDEGRTRDIQLGRLTLYQLSYFRIYNF